MAGRLSREAKPYFIDSLIRAVPSSRGELARPYFRPSTRSHRTDAKGMCVRRYCQCDCACTGGLWRLVSACVQNGIQCVLKCIDSYIALQPDVSIARVISIWAVCSRNINSAVLGLTPDNGKCNYYNSATQFAAFMFRTNIHSFGMTAVLSLTSAVAGRNGRGTRQSHACAGRRRRGKDGRGTSHRRLQNLYNDHHLLGTRKLQTLTLVSSSLIFIPT